MNEMASSFALVPSSPQLESWHRYDAHLPPSGSLRTVPAPMAKKYPSPEDWQNIRPIFTHLYVERDLSLKDIMVMLAEEYEFHAQYAFLISLIDRTNIDLCRRYMYLARIRKWNLFKNLKAYEKENFAEAELNYLKAAGEPPSQFLHQRLIRRDTVERHLRQKTKEMNGPEARGRFSMIRIFLRISH
jgi:hypothetical protein